MNIFAVTIVVLQVAISYLIGGLEPAISGGPGVALWLVAIGGQVILSVWLIVDMVIKLAIRRDIKKALMSAAVFVVIQLIFFLVSAPKLFVK